MSLFRSEVVERRGARLHGDVIIALPISWQIIGYATLVSLVAVALFLISASYARVETVSGTVALDRGVVPIVPTRPGVIVALHAAEGQRVDAGAPLARVSAGENMTTGGTAAARTLAELGRQDASLANQSAQMAVAADAEQSRLHAQIAGLEAELASLDRQIGVQSDLVDSAAAEVRLVREVGGRGFISRRDVLAREEVLLSRRQQLAQFEQQRAAKSASLAEARRSVAELRGRAAAQRAGVDNDRAELAQRRTAAQLQAGYVLTAPVRGTVTALAGRVGQPASTQQPLMSIVPAGARYRAELHVPTRAAGFLEVGQEVRLAVDAFPYERFGTIRARISSISAVALPRQDAEGAVVPVYLVAADLPEPWIRAFGRRQALLPGMVLTARIVTDERSLIEWLFEPLFAVRNR